MHSAKIYGALAVVGIVAAALSYSVQTTDLLKGALASPAACALLAVLYQLLQDEAAFKKKRYFDMRMRVFNIGAASHMANAAFDKHVEFCEEYLTGVHDNAVALFNKGPSENTLTHANNCASLRKKYIVWLTDEINSSLEPYEAALREIGAKSGAVEKKLGLPQDPNIKSQAIREAHSKVFEVLGLEPAGNASSPAAAEMVVKQARKLLGIEELTEIRKYLVKEAVGALKSS